MNYVKLLQNAAKLADSAEVYTGGNKNISVSFENNKIKDSSSSDLSGTGVRVIRDGKVGFSSSTRPNDETVASNAAELARHGKKVGFEFPKQGSADSFKANVESVEEIGESFCVEQAEKAAEMIRELGPEVQAFSGISRDVGSGRLLNSNGLDVEQQLAFISWYCGLTYNTEGNFIQIYETDFGDSFDGFDKQVEKVKLNYRLCSNNVKMKTGKYKVLFSPRGFLHLTMVFNSCLSGLAVAKGISPWQDRLGQKLFDERISMVTDLVTDDAPFKLAYDGEGVNTGLHKLIENGTLKSFYHSLDTAAQCGHEPTGHGFRSSTSQPGPSLRCPRFEPGEDDLGEMMKEADVWVDELLGTFTSNPFAGVVTGNVSLGFVMKDGERDARVKDAMLSVNVFELFKTAVLALSKQTDRQGSWTMPYLLIDNVSIASK